MRRIILDINHIDTPEALQIYIRHCLNLPDWYGCNLDALHDVLCEMDQPTKIELVYDSLSPKMEAYLPRLRQVMEDAAEENGNVIL